MSEYSIARTHMIDGQLRPNEVNDERVIGAINEVPREKFVPKTKRDVAYVDEDIAVGEGRYLIEPMIFARLLVAANIQSSDLVLDIGCATGYSTAVISHLADAVVALEEDETLANAAEKKLAELEIMNAAVVKGALGSGVSKQGPYDIILMAGAVEDIPMTLVRQLKEGGRLICVKMVNGVGRGHIVTMRDGIPAGRDLFDANVAKLPGFEEPKGFEF